MAYVFFDLKDPLCEQLLVPTALAATEMFGISEAGVFVRS